MTAEYGQRGADPAEFPPVPAALPVGAVAPAPALRSRDSQRAGRAAVLAPRPKGQR